ncbi:MAG TPA: hypothetical protein PLA27_04460 [Anaerolineales bacterium]|jgi:hypothetical protein|nr:hypothetical protein [Anaerolineales bacterium]HQX15651.1 hypothetical protein [Anaerolineales bacterium]
MEVITQHSLNRATDEAVRLWALASAQHPAQRHLILDVVAASVIEATSNFALNARRAMEILPRNDKFPLVQHRWNWAPTVQGEMVQDLWDALNRIIHAKKLRVGFEKLPSKISVIEGGAVVVPYIQAATDRKELAFIDLFALAHAYLYGAYLELVAEKRSGNVH